eukprot:TRINITY_DN3877_c0_g1_i2.p1 TRINITY_DN3877_c0_g1~~TRINITY_DN3877_c0_g1_i2.p1  ORF type:complete len:220 (+),score=29.26 TRINITY_DN3877_c0_g1_i2:887-1546(+)
MDNRRGGTSAKKNWPKIPEVFLDETYAHIDHVRHLTWYDTAGDRAYQIQHNDCRRIDTIGAGIVEVKNNKLCGRWVEIPETWVYKSAKKAPDADANADAEEGEEEAPAEQTETQVGRRNTRRDKSKDKEAYHGGMTADKFEGWFEGLCKTLKAQGYKKAMIVMDGARAHKRNLNKGPTTVSKKEVMVKWLTEQGIDVPKKPNGKTANKSVLYEVVLQHK